MSVCCMHVYVYVSTQVMIGIRILPHHVSLNALLVCLLGEEEGGGEDYLLATSKQSYQNGYQLVTGHTHGDLYSDSLQHHDPISHTVTLS